MKKQGKQKFLLLILFVIIVGVGASAFAQEVLTWHDCLSEAQKNNPDLISAEEGITVQKASKDIAASGLYPQISATAGGSTAKTSSTSSAGVSTSSTSDSYSYGVSGSQLIFDGLKSVHDVRAASENVEAAKYAYRFASSGVRLNLRSAFINVLKAQELISVAEEIGRIRKDSLELITLQYQSGLEHKGALLTAEANVAEANFELNQARRNLVFSQQQLAREMGREEFAPFIVQEEFVVYDMVKDKPDLEALVKNNPSVLQAVAEKNASSFGIKSAYGNFSPVLSATAGADKKSAHWPPKDEQWDVGLSVTMPLFEGGLKTAQLSQAYATFRQSEANERSIRDAAIVGLERTWAALQDAVERVDVQRKSLDAAEERAIVAEAQYSTGFISFDNWIIIEDDLVRVKKAYLDAQANALLAEANWIQAKGETLEYAQ